MSGAIPPLPQYAFMTWCLVKHRDLIFQVHASKMKIIFPKNMSYTCSII